MAVHKKSESNYLKVGNGTPWNTKVESDKVQLRTIVCCKNNKEIISDIGYNNANYSNHNTIVFVQLVAN